MSKDEYIFGMGYMTADNIWKPYLDRDYPTWFGETERPETNHPGIASGFKPEFVAIRLADKPGWQTFGSYGSATADWPKDD